MKRHEWLRENFGIFNVLLIFGVFFFQSIAGSIEMDVTIYEDDYYQAVMVMSLPKELVTFSGGPEYLEQQLDQGFSGMAAKGADPKLMSWKRLSSNQDNVLNYEIHTGLQPLSSWSEARVESIQRGTRTVKRIEIGSSGYSAFGSETITVHVGKVYETNGVQVKPGTVRWINPKEEMYIVYDPRGKSNWIPLAGAGIVLFILGGVILVTGLRGKLRIWAESGFSAGKWRMQELKLNNDLNRLAAEQKAVIQDLGKKAWEARVSHPDYTETYSQLEALVQEQLSKQADLKDLEQRLVPIQQSRAQVEKEYTSQLSAFQEQRRAASSSLSQFETEKKRFERQLTQSRYEENKLGQELSSLRTRMSAAQTIGGPNAAEQTNMLQNAILAIEQKWSQLAGEMPRLEAELSQINMKQAPLREEIQNCERQIAQLTEEQHNKLQPLDHQIVDLQGQMKTIREQITGLLNKMTPLMVNLGPQVERIRPESAALTESYGRVDRLKNEEFNVRQQRDLLKSRLSALDRGALRNFYLIIGFSVVALMLIIFLVWLGL